MRRTVQAAALLERAVDVLERFPEELRAAGPCAAYLEGVAELEDLVGGLSKERDPRERRAYRADIRRAIKRAARAHPRCVLRLRQAAERMVEKAGHLPAVPPGLDGDGSPPH